MKILHTGDLHLDSPFSGEDVRSAALRRQEGRELLTRIFEYASAEKVDIILIAGDLFDSPYVSPETAALCIDLFKQAECPVVISPGNHDPYVEGSFYKTAHFSDNVYIFTSEELGRFDLEPLGVTVWGYAFTSQSLKHSPLEALPDGERGGISLLCAHADTESPASPYAPLNKALLSALGADYSALGHIHKAPAPIIYEGGEAHYCGFAEGRSFDELGDGRVLLADLSPDTGLTVTPVCLSHRRYEIIRVRCDDVHTEDELTELIKKAIEDGDKQTSAQGMRLIRVIRVMIEGFASPDATGGLNAIKSALSEGLGHIEFVDDTLPFPSASLLASDPTLRGEIYRILLPALVSDDPHKRKITASALRIALSAIDGKDIVL